MSHHYDNQKEIGSYLADHVLSLRRRSVRVLLLFPEGEKNLNMVKESKIIIIMVMNIMIIVIIMIIMIIMIIHLQIGHLVISSGQTYGATEAGASQNLRENYDQACGDLVMV